MSSSLNATRTPARQPAVSTNPTTCPATVHAPAPARADEFAMTPSAPTDSPALPGHETISLPLGKIMARFSQELHGAITSVPVPDLHIALPLTEIIEQLARGTVRVPFGIIRHATPAGYFTEKASFDPLPVTLPLDEIIARISPSQLPRRQAQKRTVIPDSVTAPFRGNVPTPLEPAVIAIAAEPEVAAVVTPAPVAVQAPPAPPAPPVVATVPAVPATQPLPAASPRATTPIRVGPPQFVMPMRTPVATPSPALNLAPAPALVPAQAPTPSQSRTTLEPKRETSFFRAQSLVVPLHRLVSKWPQPVLDEISQSQLAAEQVELPVAQVEAGLKQGRLVFKWRQVREWIQSVPRPLTDSVTDAVELEFPLRIIAPLFLSRLPQQPKKRVNVGEAIPNLFGPGSLSHDTSAFQQAEVELTTKAKATEVESADIWEAQVAPITQAVAAMQDLPKLETVAEQPVGAPSSARNNGTSFLVRASVAQIFDEPQKTSWTPTEIVRKTSRLKGVAGVCIFTADGLLVAEQYPALVGVDTFCALVTQMFNRVNGHAMELRLGGPTRMSFVAEGVTYETFKCGRVYLTAVSQPGDKLPIVELIVITDHLTRQSR